MKRGIFIALGLLLANPAWADHHESLDNPMGDEASLKSAGVASMPTGSVGRAAFTTGISEREPMDSVTQLTSDHVIVYFFSELNNLAGQTVVHRWEYNGELVSEVPLAVAGPRWRTYSSKNLEPMWVGEWTVSVVDEAGNVLAKRNLAYTELEGSEESVDGPVPASPMD